MTSLFTQSCWRSFIAQISEGELGVGMEGGFVLFGESGVGEELGAGVEAFTPLAEEEGAVGKFNEEGVVCLEIEGVLGYKIAEQIVASLAIHGCNTEEGAGLRRLGVGCHVTF